MESQSESQATSKIPVKARRGGFPLGLGLALLPLAAGTAFAAPPARSRAPQPADVKPSEIRDQYWNRAEESDLSVVQNRLYSKSGKLELGAFGGSINTDPFLSVRALGGSLGYHFSEVWGLRALAFKEFVNPSSAFDELAKIGTGVTANTNEPRSFAGGELEASVLYGKLSLLGKAIIYYDFHFLGGGGVTNTESGHYFTPYGGLGQQIYLGQAVALRIDYRAMHYNENIVEKVRPAPYLGTVVESRGNWTHAVTLGLTLLIGG
jgi:outer membrane beta-barrel protein